MHKLSHSPFNGVEVRISKDGKINLTDLWRASGKIDSKAPKHWLLQDSTLMFLDAVSASQKVTQDYLLKKERGRAGSTYAHKQIALAYAKYLSPELHVAVNNVFFQRLEEQRNPGLAVDRAVLDWRKQGKNDEWISTRLRSKAQRGEFTATLSEHGVANKGKHDNGYSLCTNAIYSPLFGGDAKTIKQKRNIPQRANIRDSLGSVELAAVMLSEAMAAENIKTKNLHGNSECANECKAVSVHVAKAVRGSRKKLPHNIG